MSIVFKTGSVHQKADLDHIGQTSEIEHSGATWLLVKLPPTHLNMPNTGMIFQLRKTAEGYVWDGEPFAWGCRTLDTPESMLVELLDHLKRDGEMRQADNPLVKPVGTLVISYEPDALYARCIASLMHSGPKR